MKDKIILWNPEPPEGSDNPEDFEEKEQYHFMCLECKKVLHFYGEICPVCGGKSV